MARNEERIRREAEEQVGMPEPAHDPAVVAEAMREGVPVAAKEAEVGAPVDRVFTDTVDVIGAYNDAMAASQGNPGTDGPVNRDVIAEAMATLQKYRAGKAQLEQRIVENEEYFRLLHNGRERQQKAKYGNGRYHRNTAWLFSAMTNKIADFMDNFPEATVLPRELSDEESARQLTAVIPAIIEKNKYKKTFRHKIIDKVKDGGGIEAVVWDPELENGLGDVAIRRIDPLNIFWEPGIEDVQQSANLFTVELRNNADLIAQYPDLPDLKDHLSTPGISITRYVYNDSIDTSDKSYVINWYYKKRQGDRVLLQYCRFVNDVVLYASENDPRYAAEGWYRHGKYPFVFDPMYPEVGTPYGFGEIDIGRDAQEDIDELNNEILRNVKQGARRRYFSRNGGGINEQEFVDLDRDIVHVEGNLDDVSIREITSSPFSSAVLEVYAHKIDELKETTSNRDVTQGGSGGTGGTASGIAQLMESGNKVSRDLIGNTYEAFREMCELVIELIRQFYDVPRTIRVIGQDGQNDYMQMSNAAMQSRTIPGEFGVAAYQTAEPVYDVSVKASKNNPYSRQQTNQDAINMYGMGFFQPENGVQALACLELMEMDNKDKIKQVITANYDAYIQAQQAAAAQMMQMQAAGMQPAGGGGEQEDDGGGSQRPPLGNTGGKSIVEKARAAAAAGTAPR